MRISLKLAIIVILLLNMRVAMAQHNTTAVKGVLTADSLASGNLKDVLTSFFQLSFNKLVSPNKELNFSSNPYAILLKSNPSAAQDINYPKYKYLRKLNFNFGLKLDSSYRFNGFSSGFRYAIINKRDSTTSAWLFDALGKDSLSVELNTLQDNLLTYMNTAFPNKPENFEKREAFVNNINTLLSDNKILFNQLDTSFQRIVKEIAKQTNLNHFSRLVTTNPKVNVREESQVNFSQLKQELQKKLLWTVSLSDTTYKDQFFFSNILLKTELLKGMGKLKPGANWEFNVQASFNVLDDSVSKGRDLKRSIFRFEPGINCVVRSKGSDQSFLEFKFSGEYNRHFGRFYANEKKEVFTFNGTFRVRIINDIWIPIEFKYDPDNGNVFGFLSARLNFTTLAKAVMSK